MCWEDVSGDTVCAVTRFMEASFPFPDLQHGHYIGQFMDNLNRQLTVILDWRKHVGINDKDTWMHKLLRKPRVTCHPLRHILFLGFLNETISSMLSRINFTYGPFRKGPWPCLNKAADHYNEHVINSYKVSKDSKTGVPVGTFSCSCGFVYSRRGPDKTSEDKYKIGRIKQFGEVWERKLDELSKTHLSLRKKAKILGVDPMTVKKKLEPTVSDDVNLFSDCRQEEYRKEWMDLLQRHNEKSITEIRILNPKIYSWLYRNDKDWLQIHYPSAVVMPKSPHIRIDWEKRDEELAQQVKGIQKDLIAEEITRITKNEIGRRIEGLSITSLYKNLDKMPITNQTINEIVESLDQFQKRRIKNVASRLRKSNPVIKEWELIRAAGLKSKFIENHKKLFEQEIEL